MTHFIRWYGWRWHVTCQCTRNTFIFIIDLLNYFVETNMYLHFASFHNPEITYSSCSQKTKDLPIIEVPLLQHHMLLMIWWCNEPSAAIILTHLTWNNLNSQGWKGFSHPWADGWPYTDPLHTVSVWTHWDLLKSHRFCIIIVLFSLSNGLLPIFTKMRIVSKF